jgi:hypothetical protein
MASFETTKTTLPMETVLDLVIPKGPYHHYKTLAVDNVQSNKSMDNEDDEDLFCPIAASFETTKTTLPMETVLDLVIPTGPYHHYKTWQVENVQSNKSFHLKNLRMVEPSFK